MRCGGRDAHSPGRWRQTFGPPGQLGDTRVAKTLIQRSAAQGAQTFARHSPGDGRPCPAPHGMLDNTHELLGGLAVLLGAFVTIICVPMTAVLLVTMFRVALAVWFQARSSSSP